MNAGILKFLILMCIAAAAQGQADSLNNHSDIDSLELRYGVVMCDTLPELADSVYKALKTKKFESLIAYIATVDMIKEEFDTLDLGYLERFASIKAQNMFNQLQKQHSKMLKTAKSNHLNLREMELVNHRYRQKTHEEGHQFGEVIYLCKSGRHQFYISFIAINMLDRWFLADELSIEELLGPLGGR